MMESIKNKMMEQNAHAVKHIKVVGITDAHGTIKEINKQIDKDFGLAGPLTLSSISERVHAIRWSALREVFAVETNVKRVVKETIAAGISKTNDCPYCEDVHETSIASAGDRKTSKAIVDGTWETLENEKTKKLIEWSLNTRNPNAEIIKNPPFSKNEATEIIGTALTFHSTNRLANIFLDDSPLPKFLTNPVVKKMALNMVSKTLFKAMVTKQVKAADQFRFIPNRDYSRTNQWAENIPMYAKTLDAEALLLQELEQELIPTNTAVIFKEKIKQWQGKEMPLGRAWLNNIIDQLPEEERPVASFIFLSAFAPYTIVENDIKEFRSIKHSDKDVLEVCFWSIQLITNRISEWLLSPFTK